ncbi:hypothetical protein BJ085DRAFT_36428 [Dimargaris cristalligena]|uniref:Uncharacterized protein n=1 Tax=Dimargaris cristalligena TaxID=215637 RepID=A0A4P9ZPZ6_9FUNG|nr:hypothetical protein BJ085DRAFT_36428 [Dimargaris cristalligena]|eukprot:RKP34430.1 hypothetical protein BJ085DRAFT_36428 [Dimargaris cristalligena]
MDYRYVKNARDYDEFLTAYRDSKYLTDNHRATIDLANLSEVEFQNAYPLASSIGEDQLFTLWKSILLDGLARRNRDLQMTFKGNPLIPKSMFQYLSLSILLSNTVTRTVMVALWNLYRKAERRNEVFGFFRKVVDSITNDQKSSKLKIEANARFISDRAFNVLMFAYTQMDTSSIAPIYEIFNSAEIPKYISYSINIHRDQVQEICDELFPDRRSSFEEFWPSNLLPAVVLNQSPYHHRYQHVRHLLLRGSNVTSTGSLVQQIPSAWIRSVKLDPTKVTLPTAPENDYVFDQLLQDRDERVKVYKTYYLKSIKGIMRPIQWTKILNGADPALVAFKY